MRMVFNHGRLYSYSEQGATLIIVLMIVLLLSLIGAIAIRSGQVSLDTTVSFQANQLLTQSSDVTFGQLEMSAIEESKQEPGRTKLDLMTDNDGPIGMLQIDGQKLREYILCYQPTVRDSLYADGENRVIVDKKGSSFGTDINADGYCRVGTKPNSPAPPSAYYTSARSTVASQVSITRPTLDGSGVEVKPLSHMPIGQDSDSVKKDTSAYFRATVTSLLPVLSISSSASDAEKCLQLPIGGLAGDNANDSQIQCFAKEDIPINIQVHDYAYIPEAQ